MQPNGVDGSLLVLKRLSGGFPVLSVNRFPVSHPATAGHGDARGREGRQALATARSQVIIAILRHDSPVDVRALETYPQAAGPHPCPENRLRQHQLAVKASARPESPDSL
jgi:hypothetical protein